MKKLNWIKSLCQRILSIGVTGDATYALKKEIMLVNFIAAGCVVLLSGYAITNIVIYPILGVINILTIIGILGVFLLNHRYKFKLAKFWFFSLLSGFFILTNLMFPNSIEYYLLCLLTVGLLLFTKNYVIGLITIFLLAAILIPKFIHIPQLTIDTFSNTRIILNTILGLVGMVVIVKYIKNTQTEYQNQLSFQKDRLTESNKSMEKLFAILSHDIRSPLAGTIQVVDLLLSRDLSDEKKTKILSDVSKQLKSMYSNVDGLLAWSKNNIQKMEAKAENIILEEAVHKILDEFSLPASTKRITFSINITNKVIVYSDPQHLNLILRNLLANALKFSHMDGSIEIFGELCAEGIKIKIIDYGIGINKEKVDSLFQNIQDPAWGTSGEKGTGLGLMLVKDLVVVNHGKISVESVFGKKTVFSIILPQGIPDLDLS